MATWQCDFYIIPRALAPAWEEAWVSAHPAGDWAAALDRFLPRAESWHPALQVWGTDDGHRVDAWLRQGHLASLLVRIDTRTTDANFSTFCQQMVELAHICGDTVLVSPAGLVVEAQAEDLVEAVCASAARRYVSDPEAFLRRVQLGGPEDG
ncbi:MAG: hypothetical protein L0099_15355 [Acidobacteria bacterium]|nr:hypothetical protein [Acidobacteriota bacterium]